MKTGDKVVCVDDSPCRCRIKCGGAIGLKLNSIYVIEGFDFEDGELLLLLVGFSPLTMPIPHKGRTMSASRFRLLDHLKERTRQIESEGLSK